MWRDKGKIEWKLLIMGFEVEGFWDFGFRVWRLVCGNKELWMLGLFGVI